MLTPFVRDVGPRGLLKRNIMPNGVVAVTPGFERAARRPSMVHALGELRFPFEATMLLLQALVHPWPHAAPGQGKVVMLIPGFMAGDMTLLPLANFLRWLGHRPVFGGIWSNSDCPRLVLQRLGKRVEALNDRHGGPIVLVGQSLGGLYARELAHRHPELVERVITLGAPIYAPRGSSNRAVLAMVRSMARLRGRAEGCLSETCTCGLELTHVRDEYAPTTVIYSRSDGVVHCDSCIDRSGSPLVDNVEVMGSHIGMGMNLDVYRVIADRLMQPRDLRPRRVEPRAIAAASVVN
jgi:triacylglycerol lipase